MKLPVRGAAQVELSPVAYATDDGVMVGHNGTIWLYRVLPQHAYHWLPQSQTNDAIAELHTMLVELGGTSKPAPVRGMTRLGGQAREIHLLSLAWDERYVTPHRQTTEPHRQWLQQIFDRFTTGHGLFAVGVRLWPANRGTQTGGLLRAARNTVRTAIGDGPDLSTVAADKARVHRMLARVGGKAPTEEQRRRMEFWWNGGRLENTMIVQEPDGLSLSCNMWTFGLELSALIRSEHAVLNDHGALWASRAITHHNGCVCVSVRADLLARSDAREMFRRSRRKSRRRVAETAVSGDVDRDEDYDLGILGKQFETHFIDHDEPMLRNTSVVMARQTTLDHDTFRDTLASSYGLHFKPVEMRQHDALKETLPCATGRLGRTPPFAQDMSVGMISSAGLGSHTEVGDDAGLWVGLAMHNMTPAWVDPYGAAKQNKPPAMAVIGEPGAGKTFLLQLLGTQGALAGLPVVFVQPKPADSLAPFAEAAGGRVVRLSGLTNRAGALDPFGYAAPEHAAKIANAHILTVFTEFTEEEEVYLATGLEQAALEGARCVGQALEHPAVPARVRQLVQAQLTGSQLFALGIASEPPPKWDVGTQGGLVLVEFDRALDLPAQMLPTAQYDRETRLAIATLRLVARAALEQMWHHGGGVLILDEAHVFLSSADGRAMLQRLGREGRSQRILPILATQRIADVVGDGMDMESYLGRVIAMKMTDPREIETSLRLCGLEPTKDMSDWLMSAGPQRQGAHQRPAMALYRDMDRRCGGILVGPVPDEIALAFSTNVLDREQASLAATDLN